MLRHVSEVCCVRRGRRWCWRKWISVPVAMTVKCVARAEGLQPITFDCGRVLDKVKFPSSDCSRWPRESCRQASPPNSPSHFPHEARRARTSCYQRLRQPTTTGTTHIHQNGTTTPLSHASECRSQTGHKRPPGARDGKFGLGSVEYCDAKRRAGRRVMANTPLCAGHWTILPAAGRRPECRQPGCL